MISDHNFIMPTCVAMTSVVVNKTMDVMIEFYVILAECDDIDEKKIMEIAKLCPEKCRINIIRASLDNYRMFKQLAHIPIACLLKFEVCYRIPDWDKILYLDGDIIVRGDLWDLYSTELNDCYAGTVREIADLEHDTVEFNAGIVLFNAKRIRDEHLLDRMIEIRKSLGDEGSMDQHTLNILFSDNTFNLDVKYNCVPERYYDIEEKYKVKELHMGMINNFFESNYLSIGDIINNAIIFHYATGCKPWIYTFKKESQEWYEYYLQSPFKNVPFKMMNVHQYRWNKMLEAFRNQGIKGVIARITDRINRKRSRQCND